jgi:hypothetical protein
MKFKPQTEEEAASAERRPLRAGIYDAEVLEVVETRSKAGNDMLKLKLGVFRPQGGQDWVYDYITDTSYRLGQLMTACGMSEQYLKGEVDADEIKGKSFKVTLKIDPARGEYSERNSVGRYGLATPKPAAPNKEDDEEEGDEIPF